MGRIQFGVTPVRTRIHAARNIPKASYLFGTLSTGKARTSTSEKDLITSETRPVANQPLVVGLSASPSRRSITVLIPCHKTETIVKCVNEILGQSYPVDSVVIIGDGIKIQNFVDPRVETRNQERLGKAPSINKAVLGVQSELVLMLDCDTYLAPDALRRMVECLNGEIKVIIPHLRPSKEETWIECSRAKWYAKGQGGFGAPLGAIGCCILSYTSFLREHPLPRSLVEDQAWAKNLKRDSVGVYQVKSADCRTDEPDSVPTLLHQTVRWWYGSLRLDIQENRLLIVYPYAVIAVLVGATYLFFRYLPFTLIFVPPFFVAWLVHALADSKAGSGVRYHFFDDLARVGAIVLFCWDSLKRVLTKGRSEAGIVTRRW